MYLYKGAKNCKQYILNNSINQISISFEIAIWTSADSSLYTEINLDFVSNFKDKNKEICINANKFDKFPEIYKIIAFYS